jgi:hypothetical protein
VQQLPSARVEQPTTAPDNATAGIAPVAATHPQTITAHKKLSLEQKQYSKAIGMSSADLGAILKKPSERIAELVGKAIAHEKEAKEFRKEAQKEFDRHIAFYYEAKQRLLNPGYRTDVDGGKDRTPEENEKNYGAANWGAFNEKCAAYSLQHADRKLKAFAKMQGLRADDGGNIDDPEKEEEEKQKKPEPRRTPDQTAQRRYEHIATAAMEIANRNPEGEIEKQILAESAQFPPPLMPLPPDVFTEVLSFITKIASSVTDKDVKAEAKRLLGKLLLHRPITESGEVLAEATREEARKRAKRLVRKNGGTLGSATYKPPTNVTSEDVQQSQPTAQGEKEILAKHDAGADEAKVNANVINDKAAEYVMTRIAQGKSVDEKILVQYEKWLSLKGDTERANALRRKLAEWKSEKASQRRSTQTGPLSTNL